jgi:hypothetical protein
VARGPVPKRQESRQRGAGSAEKPVPAKGPADPPALPNASEYLPATRAWYRTWAKSAQANFFTPTEWQRLWMLAPLVESYFKEPTTAKMAEIRLNEAKLGATPDDRARLRWRIEGDVTQEGTGDVQGREPSRLRPDPRKA